MKSIYGIWISFLIFGVFVPWSIAQNPHGELNMPCSSCHTTESWRELANPMTFTHDDTQYPLEGSHEQLDCMQCHKSTVFTKVGELCSDCHTDIHKGDLGPDCESCHTTQTWDNRFVMLDRHQNTQFPLVGPHAATDCEACHINQQRHEYTITPVECVGCHMEDYRAATLDHAQAGFSLDCENCHLPTRPDWEDAFFEHPASFSLIGGHGGLNCEDCHSQQYAGTPTDCVACHETDYNGTTNPNHAANNFPTDCETCHNIMGWTPALFDHNLTQFPLTGAHTPLDCLACHEDGYTNTPTDCIACHQTDYDGVDDPNHVTNNFSTDCTVCHTTVAWEPATFDHNQTQFPLTGSHVPLDCIACHDQGYTNTPTDCIACHETDYNNAEPDHPGAGFPTDCTLCHSTVNWDQTTWDHDGMYFPIFSGEHQGEWQSCNECHVGGNFNIFECITCHEHNQQEMDDEHDDVSGYVYESQACYTCHPDGRE